MTEIIDMDVKEILELNNEESDDEVNYHVPFELVIVNKKDEQVSLWMDYDKVIELSLKLEPILKEYRYREEMDTKMYEEYKNG